MDVLERLRSLQKMATRDGGPAAELLTVARDELEQLLDPSIHHSEFGDQSISDDLRNAAEAQLKQLNLAMSQRALATPPTERTSWPDVDDRLRPCTNCGSSTYLVIDSMSIGELSAGGYYLPSPKMHMAFCRGCGRVDFYAKDLKAVEQYTARPREVQVKEARQTPYR